MTDGVSYASMPYHDGRPLKTTAPRHREDLALRAVDFGPGLSFGMMIDSGDKFEKVFSESAFASTDIDSSEFQHWEKKYIPQSASRT